MNTDDDSHLIFKTASNHNFRISQLIFHEDYSNSVNAKTQLTNNGSF